MENRKESETVAAITGYRKGGFPSEESDREISYPVGVVNHRRHDESADARIRQLVRRRMRVRIERVSVVPYQVGDRKASICEPTSATQSSQFARPKIALRGEHDTR